MEGSGRGTCKGLARVKNVIQAVLRRGRKSPVCLAFVTAVGGGQWFRSSATVRLLKTCPVKVVLTV